MILNIVIILAILFIAMQVEKSKLKLVSPFTIVVLTPLIKYIYPDFMSFLNMDIFSEEMLIFIVLLVLADAYVMKLKDVKENWLSLIYLAGVGVVLSVIIGLFLTQSFFKEIDLSTGAIIALIAMCMATDPVSVSAIFRKFTLPNKLKMLAAGESLFNDAAVLIVFSSFGIAIMMGKDITIEYASSVIGSVIVMAIFIGLGIGLFSTILIKWVNDFKSELLIVIITAYLAYEIAEDMGASGLLAEIVAILTLTTIIAKSFELEDKRLEKSKNLFVNIIADDVKTRNKRRVGKYVNKFMTNITDSQRHKDVEDVLDILALIVNGVLFVSLANMINLELLWKYKVEIGIIFAITIIARALVLGKLMFTSYFTNKIPTINLRWFVILNLTGIKGGLSIVMLHILMITIPDFEHLELFTAITSGVIILSILLYIPIMIGYIVYYKKNFEDEAKLEKSVI